MRKGIVYYSDGLLNPRIRDLVFDQLLKRTDAPEIIVVFPMAGEKPGILTMHRQILSGLLDIESDVVFLCEHDVLYSPSHFEFIPPRMDTFFYNTNVLHVRWPDGYAVAWDDCQQVSGLCASRELLLDYYRQRIAQIERGNSTGSPFNRHYEPGLKQSVGGQRVENWQSAEPNLDIRHGHNLTPSKWSIADFRNQAYAKGWRELPQAPGWTEICR